MKFSDKKERQGEEVAYVIRKHAEALVDNTIEVIRVLPMTASLCFCKTEIKYVKEKEAIYESSGEYITYRVE